MTDAEKAIKVQAAFRQLGAEYEGRPDVLHAIREFMADTGPSQHALLYDLITRHDTPQSALEAIGLDPR